ncbi:Ku protein [Noviherbaspirillum massiliense]|uniref:Ku protein n=1 Tax=Noviherbaspirillum massiliense TaxID=1465823 RepID=UPI001375FF50|nr:Ku protein [Noviherbaspirillum massiliense]
MILSEENRNPADAGLTHAVDIFAFVDAREVPFLAFETPYYLSPAPGGEKLYALLRETLSRTRKIGLAYVEIQARQRLAAVAPCGPALVLTTLASGYKAGLAGRLERISDELQAADVTEDELSQAAQLVERMTKKWDASEFLGEGLGEAFFDSAWDEEAFDAAVTEMPTFPYHEELADPSDALGAESLRLPTKSLMRRERLVPRAHRDSRPRIRSRRPVN